MPSYQVLFGLLAPLRIGSDAEMSFSVSSWWYGWKEQAFKGLTLTLWTISHVNGLTPIWVMGRNILVPVVMGNRISWVTSVVSSLTYSGKQAFSSTLTSITKMFVTQAHLPQPNLTSRDQPMTFQLQPWQPCTPLPFTILPLHWVTNTFLPSVQTFPVTATPTASPGSLTSRDGRSPAYPGWF